MKINLRSRRRSAGFVLLLVLLLAAFSLIILTATVNRTSTVSLLNERSTQLNVLDNAAEAAVEKVYARIAWDFNWGPGLVSNSLSTYRSLVPNSSDNNYWGNFTFFDPTSTNGGSIYVSYLTNYNGPLPVQFTNQFAYNSPIYRIACNVKAQNSRLDVTGTAMEDVLLALVPITTYAIFYNGQLEFSDCATMVVNGRVHSNSNICVGAGSGATLTFNGPVTCCSTVSAPARGGISIWTPTTPSTWLTTFNSGYKTNCPAVNLAVTMTNTHSIIDIPPAGESVSSPVGQSRLFNQAHVILVVTNPTGATIPAVMVTLQSPYNGGMAAQDPDKRGPYTLYGATETYLDTNLIIQLPFLSLTNVQPDLRQNQAAQQVTQIDVEQYRRWLLTNTIVIGKFPTNSAPYPTILYVADRRNLSSSTPSVVRLVNAARLPHNNGLGFTVATPNPIYIKGNYNVTTNGITFAMGLGATTNGSTVPAAILADAVTILSTNFQDANLSYSSRTNPPSAGQTFNAALVTGAIPSTGTTATTFSGGVHNLTRFLENWSGIHLVLNTSIVNLYNSQMATNQFQMPPNYYNPPNRDWGFDQTYYSPNKQPPGIPCALVPIRFNWSKPAPGQVAGN